MRDSPVRMSLLDTPLGPAAAACRDGALIGFWFTGQKHFPADTSGWIREPDAPPFAALRDWLGAYFAGGDPAYRFPLRPAGTAFQKAVWALLREIPYGETTTYGRMAAELLARGAEDAARCDADPAPRAADVSGANRYARAVGGAVGRNPISLLIPCHRVLGASGALTGYAGGTDKKEALLRLEGSIK